MTELEVRIPVVLADALEQIATQDEYVATLPLEAMEKSGRDILRLQTEMANLRVQAAAALLIARSMALREALEPQPGPVEVLHSESLPEGAWVDQLLREHDCHVVIPQKAHGAAGNDRALIRCQTCDAEIPLP